jgi:cystathionine beta-synthase
VILPDSGDRYLSKFYSDDWLREKGFLDAGATARELLAQKAPTPALVAADPTTVVADALQLLRHHGITQMPVLAGHANVGSVQEEDILRRSLTDDTVLLRTVQSVLQPAFPEASADAPVSELLHTLREERAVLIRDASTGAAIGVLTRHDLIGFLSEHGARHAV